VNESQSFFSFIFLASRACGQHLFTPTWRDVSRE